MDMNLKHLQFGRAPHNTTTPELRAWAIRTIRRHMRTIRACNHRVVLRVIPRHSTLAACLHRLLVDRATPRHRSRRRVVLRHIISIATASKAQRKIPQILEPRTLLDRRTVRHSIIKLSLSPRVMQALCMRSRLNSSSISSRIRVMGGSLRHHPITNHHL
jgi:hypothetical protein